MFIAFVDKFIKVTLLTVILVVVMPVDAFTDVLFVMVTFEVRGGWVPLLNIVMLSFRTVSNIRCKIDGS